MEESKKIAFVTVVSDNYLHYAKALAISLQKIYPQVRLKACVSDWDSVPNDATNSIDWILGKDLLPESDYYRYAFKYDAMEFTTSFKPKIIKHALDQGFETVIYLDGDIQVYQQLNEFTLPEKEYGVCLTPHLIKPQLPDGKTPDERNFFSAGIYNAGFVAVRNNSAGLAFTKWWQERLENQCIIDLAGHDFVDQRVLDITPCLFDQVWILRQPGFHTAYWNLEGCQLSKSDQGLLLDGQPLKMFHYSGFHPHFRRELSRYQDRIDLKDYPLLEPLLDEFAEVLLAADFDHHSQTEYRYNLMSDGVRIKPYWREAIRLEHAALLEIENPFDVSQNPDIYQRFQQAEADVIDSRADWRLHPNAAYRTGKGTLKKLKRVWRKMTRLFLRAA